MPWCHAVTNFGRIGEWHENDFVVLPTYQRSSRCIPKFYKAQLRIPKEGLMVGLNSQFSMTN